MYQSSFSSHLFMHPCANAKRRPERPLLPFSIRLTKLTSIDCELSLQILVRISSMREISYNTLALVLDSWEQIRRMENFEEEAGVILYQR